MLSQRVGKDNFLLYQGAIPTLIPANYFQEIVMDIERLSMEGMDKRYALIIAGDFNLSLERGDRGAIMAEF